MSQMKALILDQDGVIADTERDGHRVAFNRVFEEEGLGVSWSVERYGELLKIAGGKERMKTIVYADDFQRDVGDKEDYIKKLHRRKTDLFMEIVTRGKIFLLFTYRPEFSGFRGRRPFPTEIRLNRLSRQENCRMAECLLETAALETGLERLILEKTEGIPLFVEEFARSLKTLGLIETKTEKTRLSDKPDRVDIPATIEEIIMARVDALSANARIVLQAGSAIEREFTYSLIRRVSGIPDDRLKAALQDLKDAELIYERMERLGRLEELEENKPLKDWAHHRDGGPRTVTREDVKL